MVQKIISLLVFFVFSTQLFGTIPVYQAKGIPKGGKGAVTPTWPTHAINDIAFLFVESAGGQLVTLSLPAGFTEVVSSPQFTGTIATGTRITVFWARATSANMTNPTVADAGDHVNTQILTYRGAITTNDPWDVAGGGNKPMASTSISVSGVTTTIIDTLILQVASKDKDSSVAGFSNYSNSNLTNITERTDIGTKSGNGGGFSVWDGGKAAMGATGNTTASVVESVNAFLTIALKPNSPIVLTPTCTSFSYNIFHPKSTANRLQTRVASQSFDTNVTIACTGTGTIPAKKITKIYAVTGTCPASTVGLPVLWSGSSDINDTLRTITLSGLNSTKAYSDIKLMVETNASELNCSTDNFSIRPSSFGLTSPTGIINTSPFTLQLSAINSGGGYSGSANLNTALQTANASCKKSSKFLTSSTGTAEPFVAAFVSDANTSSVKTTDIGAIYLNVKDATWTAIDQPADCIADSNITIENTQGLVGCNIDNNLTLIIAPNRFDINATLINSNGGVFTYLSTDLNMSAKLNLSITAQNSEGVTAENYSNGCYAKTSTLIIPHSVIPSPLNTINYFESNTSITGSTAKANNISIPLGASIFKDGNSTLAVKINFDRSVSSPANPFDFNITNANLTDSTGVSGTKTPTAKASFVYGRVRAYDIKTDQTSATNPIELEVYSATPTGYVSGMPQNVLKWYRNLNHSFAADGNVSRGGFSAGTTNSNINVSAAPLNGLQSIGITSSTNQTVHLDISPWLWYSRNTNYDYTGDCTKHPCFDYQFFGTATGVSTGVNSGTFQGSDFNLAPARKVIKKGVKVFR